MVRDMRGFASLDVVVVTIATSNFKVLMSKLWPRTVELVFPKKIFLKQALVRKACCSIYAKRVWKFLDFSSFWFRLQRPCHICQMNLFYVSIYHQWSQISRAVPPSYDSLAGRRNSPAPRVGHFLSFVLIICHILCKMMVKIYFCQSCIFRGVPLTVHRRADILRVHAREMCRRQLAELDKFVIFYSIKIHVRSHACAIIITNKGLEAMRVQ